MRQKGKDNVDTCPTVHHHSESVRMSRSASQFCWTSSYQSSHLSVLRKFFVSFLISFIVNSFKEVNNFVNFTSFHCKLMQGMNENNTD
jgi:hypothetical protein